MKTWQLFYNIGQQNEQESFDGFYGILLALDIEETG